MSSEQKLIFDGELLSVEEPVVPAVSRGLMYGDGCFETLRSYEGSFLHMQEHLKRFESAAYFLEINFPAFFKEKNLRSSLEKLLIENGIESEDAVLRFQLWRGGGRGYQADQQTATHFSVIASKLPEIKESVKLAFVETKRIPNTSLPSSFKLSNNINYMTAARQASEKGADDALMQTVDGFISETTIANLFWFDGDIIYTPSTDCDLLPGITRKVLISLIEKLGYEIKQGKFKPPELLEAQAVWICNSVREILPVAEVGDSKFDTSHPIIRQLSDEFASYKQQNLT